MVRASPPASPEPPGSRHEKTRARRARILDQLRDGDFVSVRELAEEFALTEMSVRRDLTAMEAAGLIARVRGGATLPRVIQPSRNYAGAAQRNVGAKSRIARAAVELIPAGSSVFFYSGSTVARTAATLGEEAGSSLTIVTNSLPVMNEVNSWHDPHLVAVGGTYLPAYMAFVGPQAVQTLSQLSADVAVLGCDGLSTDGGLTTPHQLVAQIGSTLVAHARRTIVVADSSKVGRRGFTPIAPIGAVDVLVTDTDADPDEVAALRADGLDVRLV
jgi:DeoR/GlpR family transcriptional regulator of sugar metabolism